ncbi:hypothetical protein KXD40_002069 [Peronospora effusa]|uniref:Uncharacterized protein n=1 Tax=Peronospora effusa TaxID=542832 RepID=A0A3R7Y0M8_9STRA|nr:hypothetical protein DD237_000102 [Peronospora effusa]UIZ26211.1 hypothetical protein KXD40_002069 [Peronospora effusa]
MHDIDFRHAKSHLEHYWRQLFGGDRSKKRRRLMLSVDAIAQARSSAGTSTTAITSVASSQKLEPGPKVDDPTEAIDLQENSKVCQNQALLNDDATTADKHQTVSSENAKGDSQQTLFSTITSKTSLLMGSALYVEQTTRRAGRPRSSYPPPQYISLSKYILWAQGPTLGSIMQRIHLNDGDVSELDFSALAQRNKRLESEGCALVARSLSTNHTVRKLIIRDHAIGDDGAFALSKMLCNNTTLEYLDLYGNNISHRGAEALAQALYGHDSLTHLCLRNNLITDQGAEALAQSITCNCMLKSLDLAQNRITRVGAQSLLDALDVNLHLKVVNLDANNVPAFIGGQLAAALARNRAKSLILESHAAEKKAEKIVRRASVLYTRDEDENSSETQEDWENDDDESVSSGFLSCSGVTDIPLSNSGHWI